MLPHELSSGACYESRVSAKTEDIADLYRLYGPVVYRRCLRLLSNPDDAADATQNVFIKLLQNRRRFDDAEAVVPWIFEVAKNHCFNLKRNKKTREQHRELAAAVEVTTPPKDAGDAMADQQMAQQALEGLEPLSRAAALAVLTEEKEHAEAAADLGVSTKTIQRKLKSFLTSARKRFSRSR